MSDELSGQSLAVPGIVVGIGLRGRATCDEILDLVDAALDEAGYDRSHLATLVTVEGKQAHPALVALASRLDIPLLGLPQAGLRRDVPNPSERVEHHLALPSVAEAAALAFGPLLLEKRRSANATCALSQYVLHTTSISSALSAASMLSTSSAGP